jgi:hypothetical protein
MIYEVKLYRKHGYYVIRYSNNQEERDTIRLEGNYLLKGGKWNHGTNYGHKNNGYYNSYRWAVQVLKAKCGNVKVNKVE